MNVLDFAAARRRLDQRLAVQEIELDAVALGALAPAPRPTLATLLRDCVEVIGPHAVNQELERGAR